jgi:ribosomal protein S18 acetylase RimI-like enzyme
MILRSLGYRTDLFFPRFDGVILDRGDYLVVQTPTNPAFYWGNFLLFASPPAPGDLGHWRQCFAEELGVPPQIKHLTFGWDAPDGDKGDVQPFLDVGFQCFTNVVLTTESVQPPPHPNGTVAIRSLVTDAEWERALSLHMLAHGGGESSGEVAFNRKQMERYRAMTQAGRGAWLGAFLNECLVGALGLFCEGQIGRFQEVSTHPDYRRQGICGTLIHHATRYGLAELGAQRLVIVAEAGDAAVRVYQSAGYQMVEWQSGLAWCEGIS